MNRKRLSKKTKTKVTAKGKETGQINVNLSNSQWKELREMVEFLVDEFYEYDPEEYAWVKSLSEHIKRKTLTFKDIEEILKNLMYYISQ